MLNCPCKHLLLRQEVGKDISDCTLFSTTSSITVSSQIQFYSPDFTALHSEYLTQFVPTKQAAKQRITSLQSSTKSSKHHMSYLIIILIHQVCVEGHTETNSTASQCTVYRMSADSPVTAVSHSNRTYTIDQYCSGCHISHIVYLLLFFCFLFIQMAVL